MLNDIWWKLLLATFLRDAADALVFQEVIPEDFSFFCPELSYNIFSYSMLRDC